MPFTQLQKHILHMKAGLVQNASPWIHPNLTLFDQPADADPFRWTSNPAMPYPINGQTAVTVLSYTVPRSKIAVVRKLSIIHVGGNPPDFTGQVIWRVLKNGGGLRGMNQLTAQVGTFASPLSVRFLATEYDTITVTAEVPAGFPNMPVGTSTVASLDGFTYPLSEATSPLPGSF
jgi:hypothetical protein